MLRHLKPNSRTLQTIFSNRHNYLPNRGINFTADEVNTHSPPPWPEWETFMDKLSKNGYLQQRNDINQIKKACIKFARDEYQLIKYLSPKHIFVLAGSGCPSTDKKIVDSGKRLRAHFDIDELNVCGSCILKGNCERVFLKAPKGEGGRTVDVMRCLVEYGLDPLTGSAGNMSSLNESVRESAKFLLKEVVEFSSETVSSQLPVQDSAQDQNDTPIKPGDWICPNCNFLNFARNIRCLHCDHLSEEKLAKLREEEQNLPPLKGDWICEKCNALNFSKNSLCFRCKERPPKRDLIPGEWECEFCYYINFRKNSACLKCDNQRPRRIPQRSKFSQPASNNMGDRCTGPIFGEETHSEDGHSHTMSNFIRTRNNTNRKLTSWKPIPVFMDFPVLGGKSDLSRDVQRQEKWKREIKLRSKNAKGWKECR